MTSEDRHQARYERRRAARDAKAAAAQSATFEEAMSFGNLMAAGKQCCNGVRWKTSVINFETDLLAQVHNIHEDLLNDTRKFKGFRSFRTVEHGKARDIDAVDIRDRAMQKCLCRNVLLPAYTRSFIYDNSASLKDKGKGFALERLTKYLHDHYRSHGLEGGILLFDFKGFFSSLDHERIKARARRKINDDRLYKLFCDLVDEFNQRATATEPGKGVGLGSEVSQTIALDYADPIDHYIKDALGVKGYGRYMDDGYIISESIERLKQIRACLMDAAAANGLTINKKKTHIVPFRRHSFHFLKFRITLTDAGMVLIKIGRKSIKSIRRKLKRFRQRVDAGKMDAEDVFASYQSWRAHAKCCNSYDTLKAMDVRFAKLFAPELAQRAKRFPCTLHATRTAAGWVYSEPAPNKGKRKGGNRAVHHTPQV